MMDDGRGGVRHGYLRGLGRYDPLFGGLKPTNWWTHRGEVTLDKVTSYRKKRRKE